MEPKRRRLSDDLVITFWGTVGTFVGAGCCLGFGFLPVLFGAADDLPPPRDAPGMAAAGAAVVGAWVGLGVGLFLGFRQTKRRQ